MSQGAFQLEYLSDIQFKLVFQGAFQLEDSRDIQFKLVLQEHCNLQFKLMH